MAAVQAAGSRVVLGLRSLLAIAAIFTATAVICFVVAVETSPCPPVAASNTTDPFYAVASPALWAAACAVSFVVIVLASLAMPSAPMRLRWWYSIYLLTHVVAWMASVGRAVAKCPPRGIALVSTLASLLAGMTYLVIGTILVRPASSYAHNLTVGIASRAYVLLASFIIALELSADASGGPTRSIFVLFGAYLLAALWACVGVVLLVRRHPRSWVIRLFAVGAVFGMVDFLLPAFAFLGAPIWQADFLGRLLDVIFYLPTAVAAILWLDTQPQYHLPPPQQQVVKEVARSDKL